MKKILFFLPLIVAVIFYAFIAATGMKIESIPVNVALVCFLISGLLLSFGKAWGGIFAIIVSGLVIYNGFNNWKLGQLEISVGVILLIFYLACSIYVYRKAKGLSLFCVGNPIRPSHQTPHSTDKSSF